MMMNIMEINLFKTLWTLIKDYIIFFLAYNPISELIRYVYVLIMFITVIHLFLFDEEYWACLMLFTIIVSSYYWKSVLRKEKISAVIDEITNHKETRDFFLELIQDQNLLNMPLSNDTEWVNEVLKRFWKDLLFPKIEENLSKLYTAEPELKISKGLVRFKEFRILDRLSPVLLNINVSTDATRKDEVVYMIELELWGNIHVFDDNKRQNIVIKDVKIRGSSRIVLRPFSSEFPFINGLVFCFIEKPSIHFEGNELEKIEGTSKDVKDITRFMKAKATDHFISPNKIYVPFTGIKNTRRLKCPIPAFISIIHVIEAIKLRLIREGNAERPPVPSCNIRIGQNEVERMEKKENPSDKDNSDQAKADSTQNQIQGDESKADTIPSHKFDMRFAAPLHDRYEQCHIHLIDRADMNKSNYLGEVKFSHKDVDSKKEDTSKPNDIKLINGLDLWMPLKNPEKGFIHFRVCLYELSTEVNDRDQTLLDLQFFESRGKVPYAILIVYVEKFEAVIEMKDILGKKNVIRRKMIVSHCSRDKPLKAQIGQKGIYKFEESVHFFMVSMAQEKEKIKFRVFEPRSGGKTKEMCESEFDISELSNRRTKGDDSLTERHRIAFSRGFKEHQKNSGVLGVAEIHVALRYVKSNPDMILNLGEQPARFQDMHVKSQPFLMPKAVKEAEVKIEAKPEDKIATKIYDCTINLRFHYPDPLTLTIDVIKVVNVPVFDPSENPNPAVIIELWKLLHKQDQKSTSFKKATRDPRYDKMFKFNIVKGNLRNHHIRILVATRTGWFRKTVSLVAEQFHKIPNAVEVGGQPVEEWIILKNIGLKKRDIKAKKIIHPISNLVPEPNKLVT